MYTTPATLDELVSAFAKLPGLSYRLARLLIHVEMTLMLAEDMGLEDEALSVGWVLLSRTPLRHPTLAHLSPEQRRMRANAAHLVPYSSRFAWVSALTRYEAIAIEHRLYDIQKARLDEQIISVCRRKPLPDPYRFEQYRNILMSLLPFYQRAQPYPKPDKLYRVSIHIEGALAQGTVRFSEDLAARANQIDKNWFTTPRCRQPFTIRLAELKQTAEWLDSREQALDKRVHWLKDFSNLRFRHVQNGCDLAQEEADPILIIDGVFNLAGMVASGKTTLAKIIIAHTLLSDSDRRITLVVGDTHTAIQMAHEFNQWFGVDPAGEQCLAVPLLGSSQREVHLNRLLNSREYQESRRQNRPHHGERWLNPVCPLLSLVKWDMPEPVHVPSGKESCERLKNVPTTKKEKPHTHLCPLFATCPSKQMQRDMPMAKVWITTPGALSQGSLPRHLDSRIGKLGDLVYEQSDLVIVDEVETAMNWFDQVFAQQVQLTNGSDALFDRLDPQVSEFLRVNRSPETEPHRWIITQRYSVNALTAILSSINNEPYKHTLRRWVKRGYFTPNGLAYRLSRRLAGLKEGDSEKVPTDTRRENDNKTAAVFQHFEALLNHYMDVLRIPLPDDPQDTTPMSELARILQIINNLSDDVADESVQFACNRWIRQTIPDIEDRLNGLKQTLETSTDKFDQEYLDKDFDKSVDTLALRLQFLLNVVLLDRHTQIVFNEWHHKPDEVAAEKPFSRIPSGMTSILPLPLTGRQYGLYTVPGEQSDAQSRNFLSMFAYTNIGRSYLLNFHNLRQDLEEQSGPNVLMMSGTSYLPHSTSFHIPIPPHGILLPSQDMTDALNNSRFIFHPCMNDKGAPIQVSGRRNKNNALRESTVSLLRYGGIPGGFFAQVLRDLDLKSIADASLWGNRSRLLLLTNSYPQAKTVGQVLREGWRDCADRVYHLKRGGDEDYLIGGKSLARVDIEQFAGSDGQILVAPLGAIGRGFNILTEAGIAAFGAVFFLTRPMWYPGDMTAMSQELNRYALAWAEDEQFGAWVEGDSLYKRALLARQAAENLRRKIERRFGYADLEDDPTLRLYPRSDLAATTAGQVIQAVGRLLRGGVPFYAYFIDAAWAPETAKNQVRSLDEAPQTSLLRAMIDIMSDYAYETQVGEQLYRSLADALAGIEISEG